MRVLIPLALSALTMSAIQVSAARADWQFSGSPSPNAFVQSGDMTLELQCDRMRFASDYEFVLDQIGKNAVLNLAMIDDDVSYGIFDLKGSGAAIKSLRSACTPQAASAPAQIEAPEGVVYCGGGAVKRQIEYRILEKPEDKWDARVTVNGDTVLAMTAYSYFGKSKPPPGFLVALLGEDRSEFLVFKDGDQDWLEYGDYTYRKCN